MPISGLETLLRRREAIHGELVEIDRLIAMVRIDVQPEIFRAFLGDIYTQETWWEQISATNAYWVIKGIRINNNEPSYDMWVTRSRILLDAKFMFWQNELGFQVTETGKEFMNAI